MKNSVKSDGFIVPVYINEKIVLDMLAIMEDGFSTVSQVNYTENKESNNTRRGEATASTSILSKLLKINLSGELSHTGSNGENKKVTMDKVHTNVSLLSKFRSYLLNENILKRDFDVSQMHIGDFIEVEGELQKNPLINCMDIFIDFFRLSDIFSEKPEVGNRTQAKAQKKEEEATVKQIKETVYGDDNVTGTQEEATVKQIKAFVDELKHSGTIDFILSDEKGTVVLSAQEQYLENDNVSEILGGRFKVLGKVIAIYKDESESIDLLRKTTLSILPENMLTEMFSAFQSEDVRQFNLPELVTEIAGPAAIVIPVAIYA